VGGTKRIVHENTGAFGELLSEVVVVVSLFFVKAEVLKQKDTAVGKGADGGLRSGTNALIDELHLQADAVAACT
jgi:hypothetical protein